MTEQFVARSPIAAPASQVFAFHEQPGAFERLTPPYEQVEVVERDGTIRDGDRTVLRMRVGPFSQTWVAEHRDYVAGEQFVDVQLEGPFRRWEHTHRVEPDGDGATMIDEVEYDLPLGGLGRAVGGGMVRRRLERMFAYRHAVLDHDSRLHALAGDRRLRVAIAGASGLIGASLSALLESGGHEVVPLVRGGGRDGIRWDPSNESVDAAALEGFDAVVNLAGASIAQRWTDAARRKIRDSRVKGTRALAEAIATLDQKPEVFVAVSAVGAYAEGGFLRDVVDEWEAAAAPARDAGVRVTHPRMSVVLSPAGGALAKMKLPFALGLGGRIGSGDQPMPWVGIDDAAGALYFAIVEPELDGAFAVAAPESVDNATFTRTLAGVLHRPALFPVPAFAVKALFGQMGEETLLRGDRVAPTELERLGYPFAHRELEPTLRHVLGA